MMGLLMPWSHLKNFLTAVKETLVQIMVSASKQLGLAGEFFCVYIYDSIFARVQEKMSVILLQHIMSIDRHLRNVHPVIVIFFAPLTKAKKTRMEVSTGYCIIDGKIFKGKVKEMSPILTSICLHLTKTFPIALGVYIV